MRLDTPFGLTLTVPSAPQRMAISNEFIALKYANNIVLSMDVLKQSVFQLANDQPSLYEIYTRFFSGKKLPRSKLHADSIRFIQGYFESLDRRILRGISHWQHDTLDIYIFKLPALDTPPGNRSGAELCRAIILNPGDKARVLRIESVRRVTNSFGETFSAGQMSCDYIKSIVATVRNEVR